MCQNAKTAFRDILSQIHRASDDEIEQIIRAVIQRYRNVFPDWEIVFLALPRNHPAERQQTIEAAMELLKKQT